MSPSSVGARVAGHAETQPDAVFCTFLSSGVAEDISFGDLFERAAAYAHEYRARGVRPGDLVIIILRHTPHLFYSFVGAVLAGAIPSFMPFPTPKQRPEIYWRDHQELFARLHPKLIVTYEENLEAAAASIANFSIETLIASGQILTGGSEGALPGITASADEVACLQHSSGTTGLKKGVMLTHRAILAQVEAYAKRLELGSGDRIASWLPLYHDMGFIACFMTPMIEGVRVIALDPFEWVMRPQLLLDAIERYRATLCWLPNFAFTHLVNVTRPGTTVDLSSIRACINCSEPCKPATFERFLRRFESSGVKRESLHVCYALAENVFAATQTTLGETATVIAVDAEAFSAGTIVAGSPGRPSRELLSCGSPIDGVKLAIRDAGGLPVPPDRIGEIFIASDFLFSGYYLQDDLSAAKLRDGWYRTGDLGFTRDDELYVTGRVDDMLIVNGRNYYAHEIEFLVNDVAGVIPGRSVAIAVDDRSDSTAVVILAEFRDSGQAGDDLAREVRAAILERLGLAVHSVIPLSSGQLVKTTSGKLSRVKNKELYLQGAFSDPAASRTVTI
jgi:fatty-acyl-CoA synthase